MQKCYVVRLCLPDGRVLEMEQVGRLEVDAIGHALLALGLSFVCSAQAGDLLLTSVWITDEVFDWMHAEWLK
jgi:hypothetical protein